MLESQFEKNISKHHMNIVRKWKVTVIAELELVTSAKQVLEMRSM